ncbi:MAG: hypothetical protein ACRDRL_00385 [Sciscionella sp.]
MAGEDGGGFGSGYECSLGDLRGMITQVDDMLTVARLDIQEAQRADGWPGPSARPDPTTHPDRSAVHCGAAGRSSMTAAMASACCDYRGWLRAGR